ncbi:Poly(U)-specific endoribonuclease-like protein, partial [Operophtera brumata]
LEYNKQRYNPSASTDFLQHEGGEFGLRNDPLKAQTSQNANQNSGKRDYVSQFPALRTPTTAKTPTIGTTVNKHNSGKRDYVAPQFPQLPSHTTPKLPTTVTLSTRNPQSPNGRRDYVAPQYTTVKPVQGNNQHSTGKVKDLVNFYDIQNNGQTTLQKVPSYSSILQGSTNKNTQGSTSTTSFTKTTPSPSVPPSPTKPMSFSDILTGSKAPSTPSTTPKPSTRVPVNTPTTRPVLPSSIVNKNQNTPAISSGPATDLELQTLSEELLRKDVNNAAKYVTVNYQEKTTSHSQDDRAPGPLLTISPEAWNIPTIQKFVPLLDNYERDTLVNEYVTPLERNEENDFMDAIMSTSVIRHLMNFLKAKGIVTPDPRQQRDFLKQLWFSLYSRGKGKIGSS